MRPVYDAGATERTFAASEGEGDNAVVVHYVETSADAVRSGDADGDGVPDFVETVAARADAALATFAAIGFRAPRPDGALGGDARLDIYLRDLDDADGSFGVDSCTAAPAQCVGHVVIDNDFTRFSYPSIDEAIRVLTSHELFHAVQAAYAVDQPAQWNEGSAVWAEERVFPEQGDFEALVAHYLMRPYRPFDRPGGGFGDLHPYGAGLWTYYLAQRFGDDAVLAIWEGCEDAGFLDATEAVLAAEGSSLEAAWIEHTRWNAATGASADGTGYPDAARFAEVPREIERTVELEGMSARYVPIDDASARAVIVVEAERDPVAVGVRAPGAVVVHDDVVARRHELRIDDAGALELVITGVRRGGLQQDVAITVEVADEDDPVSPAPGGCALGDPAGLGVVLIMLVSIGRLRTLRE